MGLIFLPILEIESEIVNRSAAIFQYDIVHQDRSLTLRKSIIEPREPTSLDDPFETRSLLISISHC